jgi:Glutathionylspermidine synthase preATP-grasp
VIEHVNDLKLQFLVELSKQGDQCAAMESELQEWLRGHGFTYGDETIPFVLMPHFISPGQVRVLQRAVQTIMPVLDRFCAAYANDAELREELALPAAEDALARMEAGFPQPARICRLDAFMHRYDLKFLEFNSDSPAGVGWCDVLFEGLKRGLGLPGVTSVFHTLYTPMMPALFETLLDAYGHMRQLHPDLPEVPRLAVVDVAGTPTAGEFHLVAGAAHERGLDAVVAALDELSYDGSRLRVQGEPVDLVYRRVLSPEAADTDLAAAARDGRACVVNPFRANVVSSKKILALLQDPRFEYLLAGDEADRIRATLPWTRILRPGRATYGPWTFDLLSFVSDNRERLVLKPASDYGGRGVMLGNETDQSEWDATIEAHAEVGDFIAQEYVAIPEEMFPIVEDGRVQMRLKRFNINPFAIGGRYAGMLTRISDQAVINVAAGGGLLPTVIGRHRRRLLLENEADQPQELPEITGVSL